MLNFEKFDGVGLFRPPPPSSELRYPLECPEPEQSLTKTKVRLITKKIVAEKRVITGVKPEKSILILSFEQKKLRCR
jgi:hypothetical protein